MPCIDAVFMYSVLVVAADSWWRIPLNVCVCAVWSYPFQVLLQIDASSGFEMETFEFQNIRQLMASQGVGCPTHFSIQDPKCPQEDQKGSEAAFLE